MFDSQASLPSPAHAPRSFWFVFSHCNLSRQSVPECYLAKEFSLANHTDTPMFALHV
jgi:hypothetical protein